MHVNEYMKNLGLSSYYYYYLISHQQSNIVTVKKSLLFLAQVINSHKNIAMLEFLIG